MSQRDEMESRLHDLRRAELGSTEWMEQTWALEAVLKKVEEKSDGTVDEARLELAKGIVVASYACLGAFHQYDSVAFAGEPTQPMSSPS